MKQVYVKSGDLREVFGKEPRDLHAHLLRLCVLFEDLRVEFRGFGVDAIPELDALDDVLNVLMKGGNVVQDETIPCRICGRGTYKVWGGQADRMLPVPPRRSDGQIMIANFLDLLGGQNTMTVRTARCESCGHIALFHFPDGITPPAWRG